MMLPLRYTGEFPPAEIIAIYPNWEYALDEEAEEGQDETTIKPELEQSTITGLTAFTAADVQFANGERYRALVEVIEGVANGINVFEQRSIWRIFYDIPSRRWQAFVETWLPVDERCPSVAMMDARIFPMRLTTRLPKERGGQPIRLEIRSDGSATELEAD